MQDENVAQLWAGRASEKALRRDWQRKVREVRQQLAEALATPDKPNDTITRTPVTTLTATTNESVVVPEDTYIVELTEFSEGRDGNFGAYTFMRTRIVEGEYADDEIDTACSLKLSPKAKLRGFIEAFLGRDLAPNEKVDINAIADKHPRAKAVVITRAKDDGTEVSVIERLMKIAPARPPRAKTPEQQTAAPEEDAAF